MEMGCLGSWRTEYVSTTKVDIVGGKEDIKGWQD